MHRNLWLVLLKYGISITAALMAVLYLLSMIFYAGNPDLLIYFFGSVFFAGIYLLLGSALLHVFFRRSGAYEGSIAVNLMSEGFFVSRALTVGANEEKIEHGYMRGIADPAVIIYGYFTGVLCFFIGMFGAALLIS